MQTLIHGDSLKILPWLDTGSVDLVLTDPPYHLTTGKKGGAGKASLNLNSPAGRSRVTTGFMGSLWDGGDVAFRPETWQAVLRVAKPGAHLFAFGGTRTFHRLACAIEDAGWELRDTVMWVYGTGFPKSANVSKAIDKAAGINFETRGHIGFTQADAGNVTPGAFRTNEERRKPGCRQIAPTTADAREWQGWGTALKPAWEPIIIARKPLVGTVAQNVQQYGTGALNIDACRIPGNDSEWSRNGGGSGLSNCFARDAWTKRWLETARKTTGGNIGQQRQAMVIRRDPGAKAAWDATDMLDKTA